MDGLIEYYSGILTSKSGQIFILFYAFFNVRGVNQVSKVSLSEGCATRSVDE